LARFLIELSRLQRGIFLDFCTPQGKTLSRNPSPVKPLLKQKKGTAMANYLLNLGFSTASAVLNDGNFQADNGNANPLLRSEVWLTGGLLLPPAADSFYQISQAMSASDWSYLAGTSSVLAVEQGDLILVRVFQVSVQASPRPSLVLNAVFGEGTGSESLGSTNLLQSPLTVNGYPRTVIDSFQLAFASNPQAQQQYWSAPTSADGAWTYCLGEIHGGDNSYSFNAGALVCTNPATGSPIYQYGTDPQMKVGTGLGSKHGKTAA
jgi:hypothetical protein